MTWPPTRPSPPVGAAVEDRVVAALDPDALGAVDVDVRGRRLVGQELVEEHVARLPLREDDARVQLPAVDRGHDRRAFEVVVEHEAVGRAERLGEDRLVRKLGPGLLERRLRAEERRHPADLRQLLHLRQPDSGNEVERGRGERGTGQRERGECDDEHAPRGAATGRLRAGRELREDGRREGRSLGEPGVGGLAQALLDHETSSPSSRRSRLSPRQARIFTVARGMPSAAAVSPSVRPTR